MTQARRMALIAAVIVIAVVAFIVLKPDDEKKTSSSTEHDPARSGGHHAEALQARPPPVPQVEVEGGKPVGGIQTIEVDKGDQVRFAVSSDVGDEIHVHGYDLMKDVEAGGKASFSFPAKIDGEFEVELEDRGEQIAKLVVNP